jgi:WhiB family transcriptional regulator, redox-sensing transcriptional regulator
VPEPLSQADGWQIAAACRGEDAAAFFAPNYFEKRSEKGAREAAAKVICARCPVREPCLEYALRIREPHGVWGGRNEMERRALLRQRAQVG